MDPQKSFCVTPGLEGATVTLTTLMKEICNLVGQGGMPSCDFNLFNRSLTDQHNNAIRMVRKIKYFVARRKFQQVWSNICSELIPLHFVRLGSRMTCGMWLSSTRKATWIWWWGSRSCRGGLTRPLASLAPTTTASTGGGTSSPWPSGRGSTGWRTRSRSRTASWTKCVDCWPNSQKRLPKDDDMVLTFACQTFIVTVHVVTTKVFHSLAILTPRSILNTRYSILKNKVETLEFVLYELSNSTWLERIPLRGPFEFFKTFWRKEATPFCRPLGIFSYGGVGDEYLMTSKSSIRMFFTAVAWHWQKISDSYLVVEEMYTNIDFLCWILSSKKLTDLSQ